MRWNFIWEERSCDKLWHYATRCSSKQAEMRGWRFKVSLTTLSLKREPQMNTLSLNRFGTEARIIIANILMTFDRSWSFENFSNAKNRLMMVDPPLLYHFKNDHFDKNHQISSKKLIFERKSHNFCYFKAFKIYIFSLKDDWVRVEGS